MRTIIIVLFGLIVVLSGVFLVTHNRQVDINRGILVNAVSDQAKLQASKLYVIKRENMSDVEEVMIATLQGLISNKSNEQIYILPGNPMYQVWLDDLHESYNVQIEYIEDPWFLVDYYKSSIDGYLLWVKGNKSINAATSLAHIENSILIEKSIESNAVEKGLKKQVDLSEKDEYWVFDNYIDQLSNSILIEQKSEYVDARLRDYAVMSNAFVYFDGNSKWRKSVLKEVDYDANILGWGDPSKGEHKFISTSSKNGIFTLPADHAYNVSVLSGFQKETLKQNTNSDIKVEENVHYVTFVMSDGDNLQWLLGDFANDTNNANWFGNENRGNFSMGWGIAPTMIDISPSVMEWYYKNASSGDAKDSFIVGPSGSGYIYPSMYPEEILRVHVEKLNTYMERTDLSVVEIIDFNSLNRMDLWNVYTEQSNIDGLIYLEYSNHAKHKGKVKWSNGKPVITPRYMLWDGLKNADNKDVINGLNSAKKDPYSVEGYSVILVHAWSKSLDDIQSVIDHLDQNIRVVTPAELIELMTLNCSKDN